MTPGECVVGDGDVVANEGRATAEIVVANTGDRPIQVGSHFHFFEANKALRFDRAQAFGMRLEIPAGTAVRFEPGDETLSISPPLSPKPGQPASWTRETDRHDMDPEHGERA